MDIHGTNDDTIPIDLDHAAGAGPHNSVMSSDGWYYESNEDVARKWAAGFNCEGPQV